MIYLAADHAGFNLKERIKVHLDEHGIEFKDIGAEEFNKEDDYPDFALAAAKKIAKDPENNLGILICGSGAGMAIAANKVKGVYCAQIWQRDLARTAREHDQVNAIALGARYMDEPEALLAVDEFLKDLDEQPGERHLRRFKKVKEIENNYSNV